MVAWSPAVRVLSFHADYRCRHTGRCCSSNWPIPLEATHVAPLQMAIQGGRLAPVTASAPAFETRGADTLLGRVLGRCVFHDTHASGGCRVQRELGHQSIPLACRQFPRQSVTDPRGTSVTLSHYCPTARAQLERATGPVTIVDGASAFPRHGEYIGLDASPDIPPLLHSRCLISWEQWWAIEARAVTLVSDHPDTALPRLARAVEHLHAWRPGTTAFADVVHRAFDLASMGGEQPWTPTTADIDAHVTDALSSIPAEWRDDAERALTPGPTRLAWPVFGRFLAAHTFANWAAYNGRGLRTWFRSIEAAGCLVWRTGDAGNVDLILRHLADSSALITRWNHAERRPVIRRT